MNTGYEPVQIVSWQKAIVLWFQNKVEILEYHSEAVKTPHAVFRLPSVLRLKRYIRPYFVFQVRLSRQNVFLRDEHTCQYCGRVESEKKLTIDHVVPVSCGGPHAWTNVVTACGPCNNKKGSQTPEQARMPLLREPVRPHWLPGKEFKHKNSRYPQSWKPYLGLEAV